MAWPGPLAKGALVSTTLPASWEVADTLASRLSLKLLRPPSACSRSW